MTAPASPTIPVLQAAAIPAVDAARMARVDQWAIEEFGITLLQMMEQAGLHLAEACRLELDGDLRGRRITVLAGSGGNGGGGLAAARHLVDRGADVHVILSHPVGRLGPAARHHVATLLRMEVECCVVGYDLSDVDLDTMLAEGDLVVDALLGYHLVGAPVGPVAHLIDRVEASPTPVVSLDLPSGMDADRGSAAGRCVTARATVTLALPKTGLLTDEGRRRAGRLYLADLGLPARLYAALGIDVDAPFAPGALVVLADADR